MLSALKKIFENETKKNVKNIDTDSLNEGVNLFEATIVLNRLLPINNIVIKKYIACNNPQKINVQLAPCHKPDKRKVINIDNIIPFFSKYLKLIANGVKT